jgi:hypothetical protein
MQFYCDRTKDEIGEKYSTHKIRNTYEILVGNRERKRSLEGLDINGLHYKTYYKKKEGLN